jgi:hypothetical protein
LLCCNQQGLSESTIGIKTRRTKLFTGNFIPARYCNAVRIRLRCLEYRDDIGAFAMITRVEINLSGTLHISSVPYPCLKCGVTLWDRRTEAPHCGKSIMLLNSLTPIFTPLRLALSPTINHPVYIGSDEGTPWSRARLPGNPVSYSGLFVTPA